MTPNEEDSPDKTLPPWPADAVFDGGETGCGELLLDLLLFMKRQPPAARVAVRALDDGAPREIPAWCRLTGHALRESAPPFYLIASLPPGP